MSGLEIERKFLVKKGDAYKSAAFSSSHIQQGYIPAEGLRCGFVHGMRRLTLLLRASR